MYGGVKGMGFDWGSFANDALKTVGTIFGGPHPTQPYIPGSTTSPYPRTNPQGMDLTTVALIGIGAFLLVKVMKGR